MTMLALAHGLCQNTSITSLCLEDNCFNKECVQQLFAQRLGPWSSITSLNASNCRLDDNSIELLVDRWLPNCRMEELILRDNNIGPAGALRLIQAMVHHPTMLKLDLWRNYTIGYEGLRMVGNELVNLRRLTLLHLNNCSVWNDYAGVESEEAVAQQRARQQAGQALLDGIKRNYSIKDLLVYDDNGFPDDYLENAIFFYCALAQQDGPISARCR